MLTHLQAEGFQSLRKVSLQLGNFTVVTGPTGSGKTAVLRALRLLAFNARGVGYISRGASVAKVGLGSQDDGWAAGIERNARTSGKDKYRLQRLAPVPAGGTAPVGTEYTKLAGAVPEDVTRLLGLSELNFAGQFDRPFLLDESGGEVARVLGRLTNVTLIFAAAREANRRRLEATAAHKRAQADVERLSAQIQDFRNLKTQQAAVSDAESALEQLAELQASRDRLASLLQARAAAQQRAVAVAVPEVPDISDLAGLHERRQRLAGLIGQATQYFSDYQRARSAAEQADGAIADAEREMAAVLKAAGRCPTCGRAIRQAKDATHKHDAAAQ
jgi:DNA repair protein SbcC/Rad50